MVTFDLWVVLQSTNTVCGIYTFTHTPAVRIFHLQINREPQCYPDLFKHKPRLRILRPRPIVGVWCWCASESSSAVKCHGFNAGVWEYENKVINNKQLHELLGSGFNFSSGTLMFSCLVLTVNNRTMKRWKINIQTLNILTVESKVCDSLEEAWSTITEQTAFPFTLLRVWKRFDSKCSTPAFFLITHLHPCLTN